MIVIRDLLGTLTLAERIRWNDKDPEEYGYWCKRMIAVECDMFRSKHGLGKVRPRHRYNENPTEP